VPIDKDGWIYCARHYINSVLVFDNTIVCICKNMAVAMGANFFVAVDQFGVVSTCGENHFGQLGLRETPDIDYTQQRALLGAMDFDFQSEQHNAVMVSAGDQHAAFVTRSGSVYTWGNGYQGQRGDDIEGEFLGRQPIPQLVFSARMHGSRATMVSCGANHTLLLTASGQVWGCGSNHDFQIGVQNMDDPLQTTGKSVCVFTMIPPTRFDSGDGDNHIAFIAAGCSHSAAVGRSNGLLWTWGNGEGGNLGHGNGDRNCSARVPTHLPRETFGEAVISVSVCDITMAVTASGALWACGWCNEGSLGLGQVLRSAIFQCVGTADDFGDGGVRNVACSGSDYSLILSYDGSVRICGCHFLGIFSGGVNLHKKYFVPTLIDGGYFMNEPVVLVSAHDDLSVVVTKSGRLFTWGFEAPGCFVGLARTYVHGIDGESSPWLPRQVLYTNIPNQRIGLFGLWLHTLTDDQVLAFLMVQHMKLGAGSCFRNASDCVLRNIFDSLMVPGASDFGIGLRNMLGI